MMSVLRILLLSCLCLVLHAEDLHRIISLGPSITEELYLLGVQDKIAGVTEYCTKPREAMKKEKVGSSLTVNMEKIFALRPDLVIATSLTNTRNIEKLKNLGIRVEIFPAADSFEQLCSQFMHLAQLTGRTTGAEKMIFKVREKVSEIQRSFEGKIKPGVIVQAGAKPLWIAPKKSFINDFIEMAGGRNLCPEDSSGRVSREQVLSLDPQVIIITTMGIIGEDEKSVWEKFRQVSAVKNGRVHIIDSDKLCSPTPLSFADTLTEMKELIHPYHE